MTRKKPWDDWVPGVLSLAQVRKLIKTGYISRSEEHQGELDHSAIDLTLSNKCWVLPAGSIKPFGDRYLHLIDQMKLIRQVSPKGDVFFLERKKTYLIKLNENISPLKGSPIYGQATAKSSIGRMDVLARLIVDGMTIYEGFEPSQIGSGEMYLEITPMTFNVKVQVGSSLSQIRLFKGSPEESEIDGKELYRTVITNVGSDDGSLSLNTAPIHVCKNGPMVSAFRSKRKKNKKFIPLWSKKTTNPVAHWELVKSDENERIKIQSSRFYIMRSRERIAVPKGVAVYCKAIDETIGEMRIHYAGFAHPYFGFNKKHEPVGTPLVFEVRGHDVNVSLGNKEKMAKLIFYRMSEDANTKDKPIDDADPYQHQNLQLSKFFKPWPKK